MSSIMTVGRKWIDFLAPDPAQIDIEDIAHALGKECRWANQINDHFSVAQHSLIVSALAENPLAGLLHDASEAYTRDIPSPLKKLCPTLQMIEKRLQETIYSKYLRGSFDPSDIHLSDHFARDAEEAVCRNGEEAAWDGTISPALLAPMSAEVAAARFLDEFYELMKDWGR